jgi:hypothetical protein
LGKRLNPLHKRWLLAIAIVAVIGAPIRWYVTRSTSPHTPSVTTRCLFGQIGSDVRMVSRRSTSCRSQLELANSPSGWDPPAQWRFESIPPRDRLVCELVTTTGSGDRVTIYDVPKSHFGHDVCFDFLSEQWRVIRAWFL